MEEGLNRLIERKLMNEGKEKEKEGKAEDGERTEINGDGEGQNDDACRREELSRRLNFPRDEDCWR